jgi:hypothetical protein
MGKQKGGQSEGAQKKDFGAIPYILVQSAIHPIP